MAQNNAVHNRAEMLGPGIDRQRLTTTCHYKNTDDHLPTINGCSLSRAHRFFLAMTALPVVCVTRKFHFSAAHRLYRYAS